MRSPRIAGQQHNQELGIRETQAVCCVMSPFLNPTSTAELSNAALGKPWKALGPARCVVGVSEARLAGSEGGLPANHNRTIKSVMSFVAGPATNPHHPPSAQCGGRRRGNGCNAKAHDARGTPLPWLLLRLCYHAMFPRHVILGYLGRGHAGREHTRSLRRRSSS